MKVLLLLIQDTLHTLKLKYWACMATSLKTMEFIRKLDSIIISHVPALLKSDVPSSALFIGPETLLLLELLTDN